MCMVEPSDAGEVTGRFSKSYGHLVLRRTRICMVESSDAGEVTGRFFKIIWSLGSKANSDLVWFSGDLVFAWFSHRMQVKLG